MKLPVIKAFGSTFGVVFGNFLDMIKILWLPLGALLVLFYFVGARMFAALSAMMQMQADLAPGQKPDPQAILHSLGPVFSTTGIVLLAEIILIPMMYAGILRFVIRGEKPGLFYLRFGGDEIRIILTFILVFLLFCGVYIGGAIVVGLIAGGLSMVSPSAAGIGGGLGGLALVIFMIWIMLRLSLAIPAAVGAQKIGIGPSWSVTKGNVWRLFFYAILWFIVIVILECIFIAIAMPGYFSNMGEMTQIAQSHSGDVEGMRRAMNAWQAKMMQSMGANMLPMLIGGAVLGLVLYPLMIASGGVAYRLMTEGSSDAEA